MSIFNEIKIVYKLQNSLTSRKSGLTKKLRTTFASHMGLELLDVDSKFAKKLDFPIYIYIYMAVSIVYPS